MVGKDLMSLRSPNAAGTLLKITHHREVSDEFRRTKVTAEHRDFSNLFLDLIQNDQQE
jgi:hypothetical protein